MLTSDCHNPLPHNTDAAAAAATAAAAGCHSGDMDDPVTHTRHLYTYSALAVPTDHAVQVFTTSRTPLVWSAPHPNRSTSSSLHELGLCPSESQLNTLHGTPSHVLAARSVPRVGGREQGKKALSYVMIR